MYRRLRASDPADLEKLRTEIVRTGIDYQLVTEFTARLAVEEAIARPAGEKLASVKVPTMLPRGWNPAAFFATATDDPSRLALGGAAIAFGLTILWCALPRRRVA
jgi:hypothetical protein